MDIKIETMSLSCSGAPRGFQDSDDMAFIDEDLLWCSDNDSKLMDLSCLVSEREKNLMFIQLYSNLLKKAVFES